MTHQKVKFAETEFFVSPLTYWLIILVALLMAMAVTFTLAFYTIQDGEIAVVTRLGKFSRLQEPGLHWRLPWGIDRVYRLKTDYPYQIEIGFVTTENDSGPLQRRPLPQEARLITGDLYLVDVMATVTYRITDPKAYVLNTRQPDSLLRTLSRVALRQAVGLHSLEELFQTKRSAIGTWALGQLQKLLAGLGLGVEIQTFELKEVIPLQQVSGTTPTTVPKTVATPQVPASSPKPDSLKGVGSGQSDEHNEVEWQ